MFVRIVCALWNGYSLDQAAGFIGQVSHNAGVKRELWISVPGRQVVHIENPPQIYKNIIYKIRRNRRRSICIL